MEIKFFNVPWTQDGEDKFDMTNNKLEDILASDNCQFLGSCSGGITYTTSLTATINVVIPEDFDIKSANYIYLPEKEEGWFLSDFRFMNGKTLQLTLQYDIWSNTFGWDCFIQTNAVNIQRQHCDRFVDSSGYPMDFNQDTSSVFFRDDVVGQYGELGYVKKPVFPNTTFKTGVKELDKPVEEMTDSFDLVVNSVIGDTVLATLTNNIGNSSVKYWNLTSYNVMVFNNHSYIDEKFYATKITCANKEISINKGDNITEIFATKTDLQAKNVRKLLPIGTEYVAHGKLPFTVRFGWFTTGGSDMTEGKCQYISANGEKRIMNFGFADGVQHGTLDYYLSWSYDTSISTALVNQTNHLNGWRAALICAAQKLIGGASFGLGYGGVTEEGYNGLDFGIRKNGLNSYYLSIPFGTDRIEVYLYIEFNKPAWKDLDKYVTVYMPNAVEGTQKDYTTILDASLQNSGSLKYQAGKTWNYLNEPRIYLQDIMFDSFTANNLALNIPLYMNLNTVRMKETVPVTNQEFSLTALNVKTNEDYPTSNFNADMTTQQQSKRVGCNGNNSLPLLKDTYAQTMSRQQSQINNQEKWGVIGGGVGAVTGSIAGMGMLGMGSAFYDHYLQSAESLTREKAGGIMSMITGGAASAIGSIVGGVVSAIRARDTKKAIIDDARRSPDDVFGQGGMIQINTSNQFRPAIYRRQLPDWAVQSLALYFHKYGYKAPETKILYRVLEYKRKNFNYFEIEGMGDACLLNQTFKEYYNAIFSQGVRIWWDCRKKMRDYTLPNNERFIEND